MATVRAEAAERAGEEPVAAPAAAPAPARRRAQGRARRVFGIPAWPAAAALATIVALVLAIGLVVATQDGDGGRRRADDRDDGDPRRPGHQRHGAVRPGRGHGGRRR